MTLYSTSGTEYALRREIVRIGKLMYERGLAVASDGNISARLNAERILATPSGLCKGMLEPDQLIVVNLNGERIGPVTSANRGLRPTTEMPMHLEAYRQRADIGAVVHAHPPTTIALSIAGISLAECMLPEVMVILGLVPTTAYATPSSVENVRAIRELIAGHDAIILQRHGTLAVGRDPWDAFMKTEIVEQSARIALMLKQLGGGPPLAAEEVQKLLAMRSAMGLTKPGDSGEFCAACGVCHADGQHISSALVTR
jgi:L-fuculose-phosphate aldolase